MNGEPGQTPPDGDAPQGDPRNSGSPARASGARRRRRLRLRKWIVWLCACLLPLVVAGALLAGLAVGTRLTAPDWLHQRIATRVDRAAGEAIGVEFGDMSVVVQDGWVPRLRLRDVVLTDKGGDARVRLSNLEATVALRPLLSGDVRPAVIRLSGAQLYLKRGKDGRVAVAIGAAQPAPAGAPTLQDFFRGIDRFLSDPQFTALQRLDVDNVSLRYEDARAGRAWTADGGRLSLVRDGRGYELQGDVTVLGGRDYATTVAVSYSGSFGSPEARFGINFEDMPAQDIAMQSPALAWLGALSAPISGSLRGSVDADGALGPLNAALDIGPGAVQPDAGTPPVAFKRLRSYFTYLPERRELRFSELSLDSDWVRARAEGVARLTGMEAGWPTELQAQIRLSDIEAQPADLYPQPVALAGATMDLRLRLEPFELTIGQLSLSDSDGTLVMDGRIAPEAGGWRLAMDGRMDRLSPERLLELWPDSAKPKTHKWLTENVAQGDIRDLRLAIRTAPGREPEVALTFDFADLETVYVKRVPPIEGAVGHASLVRGRFVIFVERGHVDALQGGRIDIAGTRFVIPDVRIKRGPARAYVRAEGAVTAALSLLDSPPFRFIEKIGQQVDVAGGRVAARGQLDFLLKDKLTPKEVAFDVEGTLHDVRSDRLLKGRLLTAKQLRLVADNTRIRIGGTARLGEVPVEGAWQSALGPGADGSGWVTGRIELSPRFAREFRLSLPEGSIGGRAWADVEVTLPRGRPASFVLRSDLDGLRLALKPVRWALANDATGELEVHGRLGKPPSVERLRLDAGGLLAEGAVSLTPEGQLDRALFSKVEVGDWMSAPVELAGRGKGKVPLVRLTGGWLDLQRTKLGKGPPAGQDTDTDAGADAGPQAGGPVELRLDRLQVTEGVALEPFRADLDTAGGVRGNFSGAVNGGAEVTGRIEPRDGRSAFRITAQDAGGVLRSSGMLSRARDGTLDLTMVPAPEPGSYDGRLSVDNLRIKDAPSLAALLNAISLVGILEQLGGEGIYFNAVNARFRLSPQRVTLYQGSAVGASMGISMDGFYYPDRKVMDMQGVLSPIYMVNMLGGLFSRPGEGLIGFNYTLTGPTSDPKVSVNPLSAFTPGLFREIFRRPPPRADGAPAASSRDVDQAEETGAASRSGGSPGGADR